jgi:hypothetical protein
VPDILCNGKRGPLQRDTQSWLFGWNTYVDFANHLALRDTLASTRDNTIKRQINSSHDETRLKYGTCAGCEVDSAASTRGYVKGTRHRLLTFALNTPMLMVLPAQLRTSVANSAGSGLSCKPSQIANLPYPISYIQALTIVLPLMPMTKSNHGSSGISWFAFLKT